jgi:hypothetical protein
MSGITSVPLRRPRAPRARRRGARSACGLLVLACGAQEPDSTAVCEACVQDGTEALATVAASPQREAPDAPEYDFLQQSSLAPSEIEAAWAGLKYERIGLTRTSCFSNCPEYSVVFIRGKGEEARARSLYEGRAAVPNLGAFEGGLGVREYARLCQIADQLGLLELEPEYRAPWPGDASAIVEARHVTGEHRVLDYGEQGPSELIALELALDGAAAGIDWLPPQPEP